MSHTIWIKIPISEEQPTETGCYTITFQNQKGETFNRKEFWKDGEFKVKNGRKNATILYWFKPIKVSDELYDQITKLTF